MSGREIHPLLSADKEADGFKMECLYHADINKIKFTYISPPVY